MTSTARHLRGEKLSHSSEWSPEETQQNPIASLEQALDHRDPSLKMDLAASASRELSHHKADWITQESWQTDGNGNYSTLENTAAYKMFHSLMEATEGAPDTETSQKMAEAITGALRHSIENHRGHDFPDNPPADYQQAVWSTSRIIDTNTTSASRRISKALHEGNEGGFAIAIRELHHTAQDLDYAARNDATDHPLINNLLHTDEQLAHEVMKALDDRLQLRNNPDYSAVAVDPHAQRFEMPQLSWLEGDQHKAQDLFDAYTQAVESRSDAYTVDTALQLANTLDASLSAAVRRTQLVSPASKWNEPNIKGFNLDEWRSKVGPQLTDQRQEASENLAHALTTKDEEAFHDAVQDLARINSQMHQNLEKKAPGRR